VCASLSTSIVDDAQTQNRIPSTTDLTHSLTTHSPHLRSRIQADQSSATSDFRTVTQKRSQHDIFDSIICRSSHSDHPPAPYLTSTIPSRTSQLDINQDTYIQESQNTKRATQRSCLVSVDATTLQTSSNHQSTLVSSLPHYPSQTPSVPRNNPQDCQTQRRDSIKQTTVHLGCAARRPRTLKSLSTG